MEFRDECIYRRFHTSGKGRGMETLQLKVTPREIVGKKVKRLRKSGMTPVHMYGKGISPLALQTETRNLQRVLTQVGKSVPVSIVADGLGDQNIAFVREIQTHSVTGVLLHVDFYRVDVKERMRAEVPIVLAGEAPAVRVKRGVLMQALHTLTVECLPLEMPESIAVDLSILDDFDKVLRVKDITKSAAVTILDDPEEAIARVNPPRAEVEEEEKVEEEAAPAEVEVARPKREKPEEEEEKKE